MKERVLDLQCRSMKNHLVFTGLHNVRDENTEELLRCFLYNELGVDYKIEFGNVHRFGRYQSGGRPIVARFLYHCDLQYVLDNAYRLRNTRYDIKQLFPKEIEDIRRKLCPVMKEAKRNRRTVTLVRDRLFTNNELCKIREEVETAEMPYQSGGLPPRRGGSLPPRQGRSPPPRQSEATPQRIEQLTSTPSSDSNYNGPAWGLVDFDVLEFSHLYSDVHCPLYLRLQSNSWIIDCNEQDSPNGQSGQKINKWDHKKAHEFRANIKVDGFDRFFCDLKNVNLENIDDNNVNAFVNEIGLVVLESAKKTFRMRTEKPKRRA
ncbi:unnamed protein product [Mytilus coruscus]|uniref:Uncharacterized protein n=1 Tax=Mytilus coruscus TaxID=42192 RepID=A0A6J8CP58_MYTCO|nr:unnamed protein product [Mytilus coruscus]